MLSGLPFNFLLHLPFLIGIMYPKLIFITHQFTCPTPMFLRSHIMFTCVTHIFLAHTSMLTVFHPFNHESMSSLQTSLCNTLKLLSFIESYMLYLLHGMVKKGGSCLSHFMSKSPPPAAVVCRKQPSTTCLHETRSQRCGSLAEICRCINSCN